MKYRSLLLWITGRRASVADDTETFAAERGTLTIPIAFAIASLIEIVAVHLLVPWAWLQWTLLIISLWGLLAFAGVLAVHRVHPHVLSPNTLMLRVSGRTVAEIPRELILGARVHRRYGTVTAAIEKNMLFLPTQDGTNVDIELSATVDAVLHAPLARWRAQGSISTLAVQVDDPAALTRALEPAATKTIAFDAPIPTNPPENPFSAAQ